MAKILAGVHPNRMEKITLENGNEKEREKTAERMRFAERIYHAALKEHAGFKEIPELQIKEVISTALEEIDVLEAAADKELALTSLTPEIARNISALWIFSGPGTYDEPVKEDRYKQYAWAKGMDRARLSYGAWLARKISEQVSGETLHGPVEDATQRIQDAKEMIAAHGPTILYNGTELENSVVKDVLMRDGIVIPSEKVRVLGEGISNTVDQIRSFALPEELHWQGGDIGIISHAPHLMRILHMLNRYQPLPKDMAVRLFPLASPKEGREEYAEMEIKGLLYYLYLGKNATEESYPSTIHGRDAV